MFIAQGMHCEGAFRSASEFMEIITPEKLAQPHSTRLARRKSHSAE
jgi:hypothetical protein